MLNECLYVDSVIAKNLNRTRCDQCYNYRDCKLKVVITVMYFFRIEDVVLNMI
jgi:hypothetical protein